MGATWRLKVWSCVKSSWSFLHPKNQKTWSLVCSRAQTVVSFYHFLPSTGLNLFLKEVDSPDFLAHYVKLSKDCGELCAALEWDKQQRTHNVVRICIELVFFAHTCTREVLRCMYNRNDHTAILNDETSSSLSIDELTWFYAMALCQFFFAFFCCKWQQNV